MANLLPSLLDRISDDRPLQDQLNQIQMRLRSIQKKMAQLDAHDPQRKKWQAQLYELNRDYAALSTHAASALSDIKDCVKRDLNWLLNAQYYAPQSELAPYPEVQNSVLNYGLPDLAGVTASSIDKSRLEKAIRTAIIRFEPRLLAHSLKVRLIEDQHAMSHNRLIFEIESELWSEPLPIYMRLRTELELESGSAAVSED